MACVLISYTDLSELFKLVIKYRVGIIGIDVLQKHAFSVKSSFVFSLLNALQEHAFPEIFYLLLLLLKFGQFLMKLLYFNFLTSQFISFSLFLIKLSLQLLFLLLLYLFLHLKLVKPMLIPFLLISCFFVILFDHVCELLLDLL